MNKNDKNSFESYEKRIAEEFENSTIFNFESITEKPKKTKKTNKYVRLLSMLLSLLIVLGVSIFSVIKLWPTPKKEDVEEPTVETATIALTKSANVSLKSMKNAKKGAISNVEKIVITNKTDKLVCVPFKTTETDSEGNKSKVVKFKLEGINENIPINYGYVTGLYDNLFDVNAISKLDSKFTAKDCGLENPEILVDVTMADGSTFNIKVGDEVATSDGYYYVSTSLKDGIYIGEGSVYEAFSVQFNNLVDLEMIPQYQLTDDNEKYFQNDTLFMYDSIKINGKNFNNVSLDYIEDEDEVVSYIITEPLDAYADDEKVEKLLSPLVNSLSASSVYMVNPTSNDLSKYGLDNPYFEIEYVIAGERFNVKASKPGIIDNNYCACIVNDVPVVYSLLLESMEFIQWNMNDLRYNLLYLKNIETFRDFKVSYNGKTYDYELSFDKVKDKENDSEENVLTVVLNSTPIDDVAFKTCYQRLTMASATKYVGENITLNKEPTLRIEILLENGDTDVITYTKYNDNYYLHKLNGIGDELIPARSIDALIYNYEQLRQGKEVVSPNKQQ